MLVRVFRRKRYSLEMFVTILQHTSNNNNILLFILYADIVDIKKYIHIFTNNENGTNRTRLEIAKHNRRPCVRKSNEHDIRSN